MYLLKCDKRNTRKRCEICLKLTTKTPEYCSVNVFYTFTSVPAIAFEQVNVSWKSHSFLTKLTDHKIQMHRGC